MLLFYNSPTKAMVSLAAYLASTWCLPARLVGTAFDQDPDQETALIYGIGRDEYLVPVENTWTNGRLVASTVRLDLVERIVERPEKTRKISEMRRSANLSRTIREIILGGVHAWFWPEPGYKVTIVPYTEVTMRKAANAGGAP